MLPFEVFIAHVHSTWPTLHGQLMLTAYVSFHSWMRRVTRMFSAVHM